jgi:polar amino acid transport system permease protein
MTWDWAFVWDIIPAMLEGLKVTVGATLAASILSLLLGLFWAIARRSRLKAVRALVSGFTEFVRRTPILVQLYFLFFVMPTFGLTLAPLVAGIIGLGLHYSMYTAEMYRAGIDSIAKGQWEAALVLDLPHVSVWRRVILPQAIPKIIPALGNTIVAMFKETALLSAIGVSELMGVARDIGATTYIYTEPLLVAGGMYFAVSYASSVLIRGVERRVAVSQSR